MKTNLFAIWKRREAELGQRITYREVADATGVSASTLVRWANGPVHRVDVDTLQALCRFFECRPNDLIGTEEAE